MKNLKLVTLGITILAQVSLISAMSENKEESTWENCHRVCTEKQKQFDAQEKTIKREINQHILDATGIYYDLANIIFDYAGAKTLVFNKIFLDATRRGNWFIMRKAMIWGIDENSKNVAYSFLKNYRAAIYDRALSGDASNIHADDLEQANLCDELIKNLDQEFIGLKSEPNDLN